MGKKRAAFFDRDGTIIKDAHYLSSIDQVEILSGVVDLCLDLQKEGFLLFVTTNQSGIARGFFDEKFVEETHKYLKKLFLCEGVIFEKFYYCPHLDPVGIEGDLSGVRSDLVVECLCRKPSPGMIYAAAKEYDIDLQNSLSFGDKKRDVQAGLRAGCKSFYIQDVLASVERGLFSKKDLF